MNNKKNYLQILKSIYGKHEIEELSKEEINFLYQIDSKIGGF